MNIKQLALVLGASMALVGGGMGAVACSSSSSAGNSSGGSSGGGSGSGSGSTMDSGNEDTGSGSSSGGSGSSSGSMGDGGTVDCGSIPTLHANPAGDVYCGFNGDAGSLDCVVDSGTGFCCLGGSTSGTSAGPYDPQMCAANAAGCTNGAPDAGPYGPAIPIQCNQISDCAGNGASGATACCLQNGSTAAEVPGCGYYKAKGGSAVVCEGTGGGSPTMCQAGEQNVCSADADCPSGTTCKPGKWKLFQLGFCEP